MTDYSQIINVTTIIYTAIIFAAFLAAVALFFVFIFKRRPKKDISLFPLNAKQDLSDGEADYFEFIRYNENLNSLVLKQSRSFQSCVVTVIYKKNNKLGMKRYNLKFEGNDPICGIQLDNGVEEYKVVLESVDKKIVKHAPIDNYLVNHIVYALIVGALFAVGMLVYVMTCYYYLKEHWPEYSQYYVFPAFTIIYVVVIIVGGILGDSLSKKGAF